MVVLFVDRHFACHRRHRCHCLPLVHVCWRGDFSGGRVDREWFGHDHQCVLDWKVERLHVADTDWNSVLGHRIRDHRSTTHLTRVPDTDAAGFFVVAGGFRIVTALVEKYPQWGWSLVNGIVTLMLGLIIFRSFKQLPEEESGVFWIIGLMVGLELLFNGWTWIMLSFAVKNLPQAEKSPA